MTWFRIRRAKIGADLRKTFEQHGVATMQWNLASTNYFTHNDKPVPVGKVLPDLLLWLTEQYDRAERKETWSLTMEVAITIFVFAELIFSIIGYRNSR